MPLYGFLRELLGSLHQTNVLAEEVYARLSDQIKQRVDLKVRLLGFYHLLKQEVIQKTEGSVPDVFPKVDTDKEDPPVSNPDWSAFRKNSLAEELESILKNRRLGGLATLERYRPKWAPKPKSGLAFADHCLASGLLYAQVFQATRALLRDTTSALGQLLNLRGAGEQESEPVSASHSAVHEVLYSILLRNLYPSSFEIAEHKGFRTRFEKREAFTYFALLCDSLQPWDRKRLFNQATGSLPYTTYAENFNLEIDGNTLRITERGDRLRIDERQAALRGYLNLYLERASDLVKLHLSEWRYDAPRAS